MISRGASFKFEVVSVKREKAGARGLRPRIGVQGDMIVDCGLKEAGRDGVRAKRSQFGDRIVRNEPNFTPPQASGGGEMRETKPNLRGLGYMGKGSCRVGRGSAAE
jgi:hypothetical protein